MKIQEIELKYKASRQPSTRVSCSDDAYKILMSIWDQNLIELQEEFKLLLLNRANAVLGHYSLSKGGISGTVADARLIFATGLKTASSSIILAHNHPTRNLKPSSADILLTRKLVKAGKLLDIMVMDHLIISTDGYFSFADEGLI
ncbi:MAG: DNA repair protein [Flavobacteriales bacterium]|nr:DNA repair protein [Flavobacteriales bacterium]